ncbi:MAG: DNA polymerase III subunit delta [Spirochaetes bacterium]|nr:DNA polymerase III subunit delta [Spirochaetota bacterium]MBN2771182.1 DNA polymerase III subunit delta [Spirochaetota bacterium]
MAQFEKIQGSDKLFSKYEKLSPSGAFLFLGEEEAEKEKCVNLFKTNFFDSQPNMQIFYCDTDDFLKGADFVLSEDMFESRKAAVFKKIEAVLKKKQNISLLCDILNRASNSIMIIMETNSNRIPATLLKTGIPFESAIFWKKFENDLLKYIVSELKKRGKTIDSHGASVILSLCGRNIAIIDDALKNIIYGTSNNKVEIEDIKHLIQNNRSLSVFECIDSIFQKDKKSISVIQKTLDGGTHELVIISMIYNRLLQMETYYELKDKGNSTNEALSTLSIQPRQQAFFQQSLRKFSKDSVKNNLIQLAITEKMLKSSPSSKNILANHLMDLLYSLIK